MATCPSHGKLSKARLLVNSHSSKAKILCPTFPRKWHRYKEGGKDERDSSIEWSYRTEVSTSSELSGVYIGPLIRLWWMIVVGCEALTGSDGL